MRARKVVVIWMTGSGPKAEAAGGSAPCIGPGVFPGMMMGWADAAANDASATQANATRFFITIPRPRAAGIEPPMSPQAISRPFSHPDHDRRANRPGWGTERDAAGSAVTASVAAGGAP